MLDADIKLLEDAKRSGRNDKMFTSNVNVSKAIKAYDSALSDIDDNKVNTDIFFERHGSICNLLEDTCKNSRFSSYRKNG